MPGPMTVMVSGKETWSGRVTGWDGSALELALVFEAADATPEIGRSANVLLLEAQGECSVDARVGAWRIDERGLTVLLEDLRAGEGVQEALRRWLRESGQCVSPPRATDGRGHLSFLGAKVEVEICSVGAEGVLVSEWSEPLPRLPLNALLRLSVQGLEPTLRVVEVGADEWGRRLRLVPQDDRSRGLLVALALGWCSHARLGVQDTSNRPDEVEVPTSRVSWADGEVWEATVRVGRSG